MRILKRIIPTAVEQKSYERLVIMEHLEFEEIVKFVSIDKADEENFNLIKKVNNHIVKCDECLRLVEAVANIQDEFDRMKQDGMTMETIEKEFFADMPVEVWLE